MQYIGKIDLKKIGIYAQKITNDILILTDERKLHIYQEHKKDYNVIMKNLIRIALNPSEVLEDNKNKDTILLIGEVNKNNMIIVVKLKTTNIIEHPNNSIMTAWIIRDKNLKKLREKNKIIYKSE